MKDVSASFVRVRQLYRGNRTPRASDCLSYENSASIPMQESYIDWVESLEACTNTSTARLNGILITPRDHITHELSLKWLIVCFHLLSFFFEIFATDPSGGYLFPRWRERYLQAVKVGANGMRFVRYSAGASVMLIAIALVSGIWDSYALIGIGFLACLSRWFSEALQSNCSATSCPRWRTVSGDFSRSRITR